MRSLLYLDRYQQYKHIRKIYVDLKLRLTNPTMSDRLIYSALVWWGLGDINLVLFASYEF